MTTVPTRVGSVAFGLAMALAAALALLSGGPAARAATQAHRQHAAQARYIRHERFLREAPGAQGPGKAATTGAAPAKAGRKPAAAAPWRIQIPFIGVSAGLMPLGAASGPGNGNSLSLPVPPLARAMADAGWYRFTAVPGTAGNAVIAGHVDTYTGPGVFYNLYLLRPGNPIYVTAGGARRRFDVTSVRELSKDSFPVNQVFGGTEKPELWLITCGGGFDYQTGHYIDNIVVSAALAPTVGHSGKTNAGNRPEGRAGSRPGSRGKVSGKLSSSHQKTARRA